MKYIWMMLLIGGAVACGSNGNGSSIQPGEACGGGISGECVSGHYCRYPDYSCGSSGELGTCEEMPEGCIEIYAPVCGCDGKTYANSCFAASAGVSVEANGECEA